MATEPIGDQGNDLVMQQLTEALFALKISDDTEAPDIPPLPNVTNIVTVFPPEVTGIIFKFCLETPTSLLQLVVQRRGNPNTSPWKLGAVCKSWRNIAWSIPQLWTHFFVKLTPNLEGITQESSHWILRSGALPLTIAIVDEKKAHMRGSGELEPVTVDSYRQLITTLLEHSDRWKVLKLELPKDDHPVLTLIRDSNKSFPLLDTLAVNKCPFGSWKSFTGKDQPLPSLKTIIICGSPNISIRYTQVTNFALVIGFAHDVLSALSDMPNLLHFACSTIWRRTMDHPTQHVTLPSLKNLVLLPSTNPPSIPSGLSILLDSLTLPSLEDVVAGQHTQSLVDLMLHRSSQLLNHIRIVDASPATVLDILKAKPRLEYITVALTQPTLDNSDQYFSLLQPKIAPNIKMLNLDQLDPTGTKSLKRLSVRPNVVVPQDHGVHHQA